MQLDKVNKRIKLLLFSAWLIFCAIFGYFAPTIPFVKDFFTIKKVNVLGTDKFTKEDIEKVFSKENWFFLNIDRVKEELKKYSFVKEVKIDRYFVGNVNVTVLERKPFAYLIYKGKRFLIDEDGKSLDSKYFSEKKYKHLPIIVYNDKSLKNDKFPKVKKIFETFRSLNFKKYVISKSQIACVLDSGNILLFSLFNLDENLEKAKIFLESQNLRDFKYVDFSFDSMVVTRR